jgi:hypothetical protein
VPSGGTALGIFKGFFDEYRAGTYWLKGLYWFLIVANVYGIVEMFRE